MTGAYREYEWPKLYKGHAGEGYLARHDHRPRVSLQQQILTHPIDENEPQGRCYVAHRIQRNEEQGRPEGLNQLDVSGGTRRRTAFEELLDVLLDQVGFFRVFSKPISPDQFDEIAEVEKGKERAVKNVENEDEENIVEQRPFCPNESEILNEVIVGQHNEERRV